MRLGREPLVLLPVLGFNFESSLSRPTQVDLTPPFYRSSTPAAVPATAPSRRAAASLLIPSYRHGVFVSCSPAQSRPQAGQVALHPVSWRSKTAGAIPLGYALPPCRGPPGPKISPIPPPGSAAHQVDRSCPTLALTLQNGKETWIHFFLSSPLTCGKPHPWSMVTNISSSPWLSVLSLCKPYCRPSLSPPLPSTHPPPPSPPPSPPATDVPLPIHQPPLATSVFPPSSSPVWSCLFSHFSPDKSSYVLFLSGGR